MIARVVAVVALASTAALADPPTRTAARADAPTPWVFELGARALGSVELDGGAPKQRGGVVPELAFRLGRELGAIRVAAGIGTFVGTPFGHYEGAITVAFDRPIGVARRVRLGAALDLGYELANFDDALVMGASSGFVYHGPFARALAQLHVLWRDAAGTPFGFVVGAGAAVVSAHYIDSATGSGTRVEPTLELAFELRI